MQLGYMIGADQTYVSRIESGRYNTPMAAAIYEVVYVRDSSMRRVYPRTQVVVRSGASEGTPLSS